MFAILSRLDHRFAAHADFVEARPSLRTFLRVVSHSCDSWYWLIGIVLLWIIGGSREKSFAFLLAFGLGFLALFVLALKFLIRRPRPEGEWGQIYRVTDPHSFPSGHAARAMTVAMLASFTSAVPLWLVIVLWVWALLVGYSRVALRLHYFSDVIVGWLIGLLAGMLIPLLTGIFARLFPEIYSWFLR